MSVTAPRLLSAALLSSLFCLSNSHAASYDGQTNQYKLTISDDAKTASVEANLWLTGDYLSMFSVQQLPNLKDGQAQLITDLKIANSEGKKLKFKDEGTGEFKTDGDQRVNISYRVMLDHDKYQWPAGIEEVAYHTDEGLMATGYSLLLASGEKMEGAIEIEIKLPEGWQAHTPWQRIGDGNRFAVENRRELLNNALFFGTAATETIQAGGIDLTLVLGKRFVSAKPLFTELLSKQLHSYQQLFGADPQSKRYLVVVNEGLDDGGAFSNSFSQLISEDATDANRVIWGYIMAHELLHFWNGLSMVPADTREEWLKEGFTDYLTTMTMARNGIDSQDQLFRRLENIPRRYLFARFVQSPEVTVRGAGEEKQKHRQLVYGGGAITALALDIELRKASQDKVTLEVLMRSLFSEFNQPSKRYELSDVIRHIQTLTGKDMTAFFAKTVESKDRFDFKPYYSEFGLDLDHFYYDEVYVRPELQATTQQKARFQSSFGKR
jgi:predicted metalloprotease with PDZ domain